MTRYPFTAIVNGLTHEVTRTDIKRACPYCGRSIKHGNEACASHRDLLPLDYQQTLWKPKP